MKLDVLAFAAHPDDVELACSGTIAKLKSQGYAVGIIDLTRGELGTRGSAEIRDQEAAASAKILQLDVRENLGFRDGFFEDDEIHRMRIVEKLRLYQPEIILINAPEDRHPDHGKGSKLVRDAAFLSGLRRVPTSLDGLPQEAWRPKQVFKYIQDYYLEPSFVVDITDTMDTKLASIRAFASQFFTGDANGPQTPISTPDFMDFIQARAREFGRLGGVKYGEGFITEKSPRIDDLMKLV